MTSHDWKWADLTGDRLELLKEAEDTLGADILLAFRQGERSQVNDEVMAQSGLRIAPLNESQLECLQGTEQKLQAIVIAYQR